MAYAYKKNHVPNSLYSLKCPNAMTAETITVHNTANKVPASNEINYMISNTNEVSFHIAVDDKEAIEGLPLNRNDWHSGDGQGDGNRKSIAIEICYSTDDESKYDASEENAIELIVSMLKERGWGIDRVKYHNDWSDKNCPHRILDSGRRNSFKDEIDKRLKGGSGGGSSSTYTVKNRDTLSEIAQRYGMTTNALASLNGISDPNKLKVGQVLKISGSLSTPKKEYVQLPASAKTWRTYKLNVQSVKANSDWKRLVV